MDLDFWHERWERGEIGFHQADCNHLMQRFVSRLKMPPGGHVLVPLCGKSLDMLWLRDQGYRVTGIEISSLAVTDFFIENGLSRTTEVRDSLTLYTGKNIQIWCGDFFTIDLSDMPQVDGVYDRASLVALPETMREAYVHRLSSLMPAGTRSLLLTLDYPPEEMRGPPFPVNRQEVEQRFAPGFRVEHIFQTDCLADQPAFREKGLSRLDEHVFILERKRHDG